MALCSLNDLQAARKNRLIDTNTTITVPIGGNTWRRDKDTTGGSITTNGIVNWTDQRARFGVYTRFGSRGKVKMWLNLNVPDGQSTIIVTCRRAEKRIVVSGTKTSDFYVGEWDVADTGYQLFVIKGISKTGSEFAVLNSLKLSGTALIGNTAFVKNNDGDFFYWGRRGPSVHLNYAMPDKTNAEWFYNEVTVPEGDDYIGSYFMACGFGEGYFGMQVNSPTERHILFSVWSPYKTDNPGQIPEDQKIVMLKKGDGVHTGEFGNEGSGGQSYLNYNWQAGITYRFLMHAKPDGNNHTVYTAYFYAPEVNRWQLIASFNRPQTNTYLKHLHSFLENFEPEQGTTTRQVSFNNEWIADENGKWLELNKAKFTIDNTGIMGYRMDYAGGVENGAFFLKNCGFFSDFTIRNTVFLRPLTEKIPDLDFGKLP